MDTKELWQLYINIARDYPTEVSIVQEGLIFVAYLLCGCGVGGLLGMRFGEETGGDKKELTKIGITVGPVIAMALYSLLEL